MMRIFFRSALARKARSDVLRRPGRSLLVIIGILVGVFGLTAINVADDAFYGAFAYSGNQTQAPDITFGVQEIDDSLVAAIDAVPNVQITQLTTYYRTRCHISAAPGDANMGILARPDLAHTVLSPFVLSSGNYPGVGEIVLEAGDRGLQTFAVGDRVTVDTPHGPMQLKVVGTSRTQGMSSPALTARATGYMTTGALAQLAGLTKANTIDIKTQDVKQTSDTLKAVNQVLLAHHIVVLDASLSVDNGFSPSLLDGLFTIMRALSIVALLLTCFLIINTVTTLVTEQTKIIGTMKAIGGTRPAITRSYLLSVLIYGVTGTVLGIAAGTLGGYYFAAFMANLFTLDLGPFVVAPTIILLSLLIGLGVPLAAAIVPLWRGTGITVRQAMAAYGVSGYGSGKAARVPGLGWLSQTMQLGLRSLFRKRGQAIMTLLALTLSGAVFLGIQTTTYSVNRFIGSIFATYGFDLFAFTSPQPLAKTQALLGNVPNIARVERFGQEEVKTQWGQMLLTGLDPDTQLYHRDMRDGRWFNAGETDVIVISDNFAETAHLAIGDRLTFSSATNTANWQIIGIAHDQNGGLGLAGVGLIAIDDFNTFNGLPKDTAQGVMIESIDRSQAAIDATANNLDATLSQAGLNPAVTTAAQQIQRNQSQVAIIYVLFYAVAVIVALVGVLGLANTLTTSVLERRREIGILRSMGATGMRVARVFWVEGLTLALIAWVVGLIVGIPLAYGFVMLIHNLLVPVSFAFDAVDFVTMLGLILVIATIASVGPAMSAARMRIADTLRYE